MQTRNLFLTIGTVALTVITINATASEALLSPRAAGNQIKRSTNYVETQDLTSIRVAPGLPLLSPRAAGNQIKYVSSTNNEVNLALACAKNMTGSNPKAIAECASHPSATMPCCSIATR